MRNVTRHIFGAEFHQETPMPHEAEVVPFNATLASVGSGVLEAAISNLLPELPYDLLQVIS